MKKIGVLIAVGFLAIIAGESKANACQVSSGTAQSLLELRRTEMASPFWEESILKAVKSDSCVRSSRLSKQELNHIVSIVTDLQKYSDQWFIGEINEYLNM